jgi:flavin-dependent dehydrogenase
MTTWDVAVIGGGVAGSAAAALLARHELRVVLFDKGRFPRQKVCGEFLSPDGAEVLRRVGVWPQIHLHNPPTIRSLALTVGEGEVRRKLPVPGWGVSRWLLDDALWQHAQGAGVTTYDRAAVTHVEGDLQRGFSLTVRQAGGPSTSVQARMILCATGRQGQPWVQRRALDVGITRRFVGIKAHFRGVPLDGRVELHTIRHGYCGLAEVVGDVSNLCCWVGMEAFRHAGGTPDRFLASALRQNIRLRARLHTAEQLGSPWVTTSYADRHTVTPTAAGIWNLGDAAAMVAPLTGDGMGMALRTAELAAAVAHMSFQGELTWEQASREYERQWQREFWPRLRWGRHLERILLRPGTAHLACLALRCMPPLTAMLYRRTRQIITTTEQT